MKKLRTYMIIPAIEINLSKSNGNLFSRGEAQKIGISVFSQDVVNCMSAMTFGLSHSPLSCSMTSSVGWSTGPGADAFFPFLMLAEEAGCEIVQLTIVVSSSRSSESPELQFRWR